MLMSHHVQYATQKESLVFLGLVEIQGKRESCPLPLSTVALGEQSLMRLISGSLRQLLPWKLERPVTHP